MAEPKLFDRLFTVWEKRTSEYFEKLLSNPGFLNTMGTMMNSSYKNKIIMDKALLAFWKNLLLPNKRDQERTLHLLNELHNRIYDLEEKILSLQGADDRTGRLGDVNARKGPSAQMHIAETATGESAESLRRKRTQQQ